jgi:N-acetylneuraminic acid mutarotase
MFRQEQVTLQNRSSWLIGKLTSLLSLLFLLAGVSPRLAAQVNEWTWMGGSQSANSSGYFGTLGVPGPNNIPSARSNAATWTDSNGNLWLFGGYGFGSWGGEGPLGDLWKFNIATNQWTWLGGDGYSAPVYGTLGKPAAANMPGARVYPSGWIDPDGKLWLFGGSRYLGNSTWRTLNDLWRFDPSTSQWTWMAGSQSADPPGVYGTLGTPAAGNTPGGRIASAAWTDSSGNLWLFGGDSQGTVVLNPFNDLWKFDRSTNEWTWMGGSNIPGQPGVYGTLGQPDAGNIPGARWLMTAWTDQNGNFWLFGGWNPAQSLVFNDLWRFNPATQEWTWMSGSNSPGAAGNYGTKGIFSGGVPGARYSASGWTDASDDLWLFGGRGLSVTDQHNDLWVFNTTHNQWVWVGGSSSASAPGVYGTLGVPAPGNVPGARFSSAAWTDGNGDFWLFGSDGTGPNLFLNDFWKYVPLAPEARVPPPTFSVAAGTYTSPQTVGITDGIANAMIYYTTDGNTPTTNSTRYTAPITLSSSTTLKAIATAAGYPTSNVATATYTIHPLAHLTAPTPGSTLGTSNVTFVWTPGMGTPSYELLLGISGAGSKDLFDSGVTSATQAMVSSIPANGSTVYARLLSDLNGTWYSIDYTFIEAAPPFSAPSLTTPAPGRTLSGSTVTFTWNPGVGATRFVLRLGTTGFGTMDVYHPSPTTGTTAQVSAIPANGAYLYARLWYYVNGTWKYVDARYTEAGTPTPPAFTSPAPGSTLPGSTVTFTWSRGNIATRFVLRLGTTGLGSTDLYSGVSTTGTSVQLTTVPTNGAYLYARLWYYLNETWKYVDAIYTEASK